MADSSPPHPSASTRSSAAKAFKPRANVQRKAKTETEKFLAEEAERAKGRTTAPKPRGAKAGRGRGGASAVPEKSNDKDSRLRGEVQSGGVFGAGSGEKQKRGQGRASSGGASELLDEEGRVVKQTPDEPGPATPAAPTTASQTKSKPKQTAKSKGKQKAASTDDVGAQGSADATVPVKAVPVAETVISDDDERDEERRDIERIWLSSEEEEEDEQQEEEDEDDVVDQKGKHRSIQRPRLGGGSGLRPVRAPRTVQPVVDDDEVSTKTKKQGKQFQRSRAHETIDVDEMDVDEVEFVKEVPSSPELRKKHLSHKKTAGKGKDLRFATETVEERAERLRTNEDVHKLRQIFTPTQSDSKSGKRKLSDRQQDRLFLLQFPPITPFLIDPNASPPPVDDDEVIEVKQEGTAAQQASASTSKPTIKKDPDAPSKSASQHADGILTASSKQRLPAGLVGKLNVHASGKITLDWGGTDMEIRLGTEVGFLQDAVLIEPPRAEGGDGDDDMMEGIEGETAAKGKGKAYALGQVEGKMVVVPDFGKLYD